MKKTTNKPSAALVEPVKDAKGRLWFLTWHGWFHPACKDGTKGIWLARPKGWRMRPAKGSTKSDLLWCGCFTRTAGGKAESRARLTAMMDGWANA